MNIFKQLINSIEVSKEEENKKNADESFIEIMKNTYELMKPITVLYIKGFAVIKLIVIPVSYALIIAVQKIMTM